MAVNRYGPPRAYPGNARAGETTPTGLRLKAQGWPASGLPWECTRWRDNPNGVEAQSPGLARPGPTLGTHDPRETTPTGLWPCRAAATPLGQELKRTSRQHWSSRPSGLRKILRRRVAN